MDPAGARGPAGRVSAGHCTPNPFPEAALTEPQTAACSDGIFFSPSSGGASPRPRRGQGHAPSRGSGGPSRCCFSLRPPHRHRPLPSHGLSTHPCVPLCLWAQCHPIPERCHLKILLQLYRLLAALLPDAVALSFPADRSSGDTILCSQSSFVPPGSLLGGRDVLFPGRSGHLPAALLPPSLTPPTQASHLLPTAPPPQDLFCSSGQGTRRLDARPSPAGVTPPSAGPRPAPTALRALVRLGTRRRMRTLRLKFGLAVRGGPAARPGCHPQGAARLRGGGARLPKRL